MSSLKSNKSGGTIENRISVNERYEAQNLLTYRGRIKQNETALVLQRMQAYVRKHQLAVTGDFVSATFGVEQIGTEKFADVELMQPMDRMEEPEGELFWKPRFCLEGAIKLEYTGPKEGFPVACEEMQRYMQIYGYIPISAGYVVTKQNIGAGNDVNLQVYIGVSHNVL
ncbi:MAG: hypothetical protein PUC73_12350 [Lachnospiraceae bacterium]|nr:hypothetical protein [Lachnospiraceae bacterium]